MAAGAQVYIPKVAADTLVIEPYTLANGQAPPYLYLDRRIVLPAPLSAEAIAALQSSDSLPPAPQTIEDKPACRYTVILDQNIRNGPGDSFSIVGIAETGTSVFPRGKISDATGEEWLQIGAQAWLRARAVQGEQGCNPLPEIAGDYVLPATTNKINLETCRPINGPIRVGQRVTLEFIPHAWDTYAAAREATRYTRGQILADERFLYPYVSDPIKISDDEYIRRFSAEWIAEIGTFRLEGNLYAYETICIITVTPD